MKIRDIIREDISAEDQLGGGKENLSANLISVLMFLKKRSEDKKLSPKMRTDSLIQMVVNAGDTTFDYGSLLDAQQNNPAAINLIKSVSPDEIELMGDEDDPSDEDEGEMGEPGAAMMGNAPAQQPPLGAPPAPGQPQMQMGANGQMFAPPTPQEIVSNMATRALGK